MESSSQDRNLPATERKLQKAIDDGQVTRSNYLSHLAVLGVGSVALVVLAPMMLDRLRMHMARQMTFDAVAARDPLGMIDRLQDMALSGLAGCTLFAVIIMVAVVLSNISVGGWVNSSKPIMPDLSRINPLAGFGRMFSKDKLTEVGKMLAIVIVLAAIGIFYLTSTIQPLASLVMQPSVAALQYMGDWITTGMGMMLLLMLVVAAIDVPLQKYLHKSRLKMSHQEFKQEHKESDGNPHVKGRLRQRQRELSQSGSVSAVPKADFVVMNPTHFAVAIRYDDKTMAAPQVISKGADLLAMRIRDLARSHAVPVLQSPMLARALYANAEIGQDIPSALYTAVAQVLAYVYRLNAALRGEAPMPGEPPEPDVPAELDPLRRAAPDAQVRA
ncbi:MAG: EscU/YscU/HrcU family type III secretion system export apparatus switch protein [Burkholderiaceae bacterium]